MVRKLWLLVLFIIGYMILVIPVLDQIMLSLSDLLLSRLFLIFVMGCGMIYILSFKVPERRRKMVGIYFAMAGIFPGTLLSFDHRWIVAMLAMLAIVLIGWLYPERANERDHA
jgi:hypothetical protein